MARKLVTRLPDPSVNIHHQPDDQPITIKREPRSENQHP
jgi:hypothetical protein